MAEVKQDAKATQWFRRHGFTVDYDADGKEIQLEGPLMGAIQLSRDLDRKSAELGDQSEVDTAAQYFSDTNRDFYGEPKEVLLSDLAGHKDLKELQAARRKIAATGLIDRVNQRVYVTVPKRRRVMSEHDGDWDWDRRFEIMPYAATSKRGTAVRGVTIHAEFTQNCGVSKESIDAYGAMVWAISDVIENAGFTTTIDMNFRVSGLSEGSDSGANMKVHIKRPDQYVSTNMIAACFQTAFFRRMNFGMMELVCNAIGEKADGGLGRPRYPDKAIEFDDGVLKLGPSLAGAKVEDIEKELLSALGIREEVRA